jgi:hypothetical protein
VCLSDFFNKKFMKGIGLCFYFFGRNFVQFQPEKYDFNIFKGIFAGKKK